MARLLLKNFCCLDLYVGSLIFGYLNVVGSTLGMVTTWSFIATLGTRQIFSSAGMMMQISSTTIFIIGVGSFATLLFTLLLAFSIMLLVGLYQNKPTYVKMSAIYHCVFLVGLQILSIVFFLCEPFVCGVLLQFVIILPSIYFILGLRSYYYKMITPTDRINPIYPILETDNNK